MKLISITDFVLKQSESIKSDIIGYGEFIDKVVNYANFLKQPLTLGMFVPCDDNGNVLEESLDYSDELCKYCSLDEKGNYGVDGGYMAGCEGSRCSDTREDYSLIYQQAKERVLFEFQGGLTLLRNRDNFFIIEDLNGVYLRTLKFNTKNTIESLFKFSVEINLTLYALKQIGL